MAIVFYIMMALVVIVMIVCFSVIQARLNPGHNDSTDRMGNRIIDFFTKHKRPLKRIGSALWITIIVASVVVLIGFYIHTLPRNPKAEGHVDGYIENSATIGLIYLEPEEIDEARNSDHFREVYDKYSQSRQIYTGFRTVGRRAKLQGTLFFTKIFQDQTSRKYYRLMWAASGWGQNFAFGAMLRDGLAIEARVNRDELNDPAAGTPEKPYPILMWTFPKYQGNEDYEAYKITEQQYHGNIYYYLAYMMSKEEFRTRFLN